MVNRHKQQYPAHITESTYPEGDRECLEGLLYMAETLGMLGGIYTGMLTHVDRDLRDLIRELLEFDFHKVRDSCPVTSSLHRELKERFEGTVMSLVNKARTAPGEPLITTMEQRDLQILGMQYQQVILDDLGI